MRKLTACLFVCIMSAMCVACTKGSSTLSYNGEITENMPETSDIGDETSKEQNVKTEPSTEAQSETQTEVPKETQTEVPQETVVKYELNTVESLEDDGKDMSAAESIRSAMKGKRSALEIMFDERLFSLTEGWGWQEADEIKDMPDTGLARINMLTYNRALDKAITPIKKAEWEKFVCVDLDQDGTKEVLVEGGPGGVALHYAGGEVYMTVINVRSFPYDVYENGVYSRDGGGWVCTAYARLYPAKGAMYYRIMTYNVDNEGGGLTTPSVYEIMNKEVTKEEYDAYLNDLIGGLTPLEWHEFNEENIDKYVVD